MAAHRPRYAIDSPVVTRFYQKPFRTPLDFYVAVQHTQGCVCPNGGSKREGPMKQHLLRLDRIAGEMNAWLLVIAIGLGMLDLAVLIAKCMPAMTVTPAATDTGSNGTRMD